jgi:TonB-linked SusC/RagA family outer membrane protein
VFASTDVLYRIEDRQIILSTKGIAAASISQQTRKITGKITDERNEPVIGASIAVQGSGIGTITDTEGLFSLDVPPNALLQITYIGYIPQTIAVGAQQHITIVLKEDTQKLDEVVVIGYGVQKKVNLTGSISTISAEEIQEIPVSNLTSALSGRLAGVTITQSTGRPGTSSALSVRAKGTWNNTDPLYVIDGIVRDKFAFDGLDANDVENLSILKDGASAAIYGARAANGVVLVNTKKGVIGKPMIAYTATVGLSDATKIPTRQNAYDQAIFTNDYLEVEGAPPSDIRYYTPDELEFFKNNSWNWLDEAWKQPLVTHHSINVSGGNERVRYFVGGSYFYETGSFDKFNYDRYNLRGNIEANITKDLIASLNLNLDKRKELRPLLPWGDSDAQHDLYKGLMFRTGQVPPYVNGLPTGNYVEWHAIEMLEPQTGYEKKKYSTYDASASLQYNVPFIKGLSLKVLYNRYDWHYFMKQFARPYLMYNFRMTGEHNHIITNEFVDTKERNNGDYITERYEARDNYQLNGFITYNNTFGKHDISALLVYEQSEGMTDWFSGRRDFYVTAAIDQLFAGSSDPANSRVDGSASETGRISYVGRANYGYDNKYLLEASFRYDGSVNFAPENRWGFFPSVSAAWRISEENFFKNNVRFVDYLKLKASVGVLGNDAIGGWQWMQRYKLVQGQQFGSLSNGLEADVIPNPTITWEKSVSYDGGFDANFLNNKLVTSLSLFYRHTYDILGSRLASLPTTFGASMPSENYATIDTKGFEVELGYMDKIGDFTYNIKGNFGYAIDKLIYKDEAENIRPYRSEIGYSTDRRFGYFTTDIIRTQEELDALPADYTIFGSKPELGMMNYKDLRGANSDEPDGKIDDNDRDWISSHSIPPINYGFSLGGNWKGWALDLFFQGVAGHEIIIGYRGSQARPQETNFDFWTDHWTPENVNASFPKASRNQSNQVSSFWTRNGSFLRLKNINLSYTIPKSVLTKIGASQIKIFFMGTNLLLLEDHVKYFDPEVGTDSNNILVYPIMKSYSMGINLSF